MKCGECYNVSNVFMHAPFFNAKKFLHPFFNAKNLMNAFTSKPKLDWLAKLQKNEKSKVGGQKRAAQMGWKPDLMKAPKEDKK